MREMKPQIAWIVALAALTTAAALVLSPARGGGATVYAAPDTSIAVVELARLLDGLDERQDLEERLRESIEERRQNLQELSNDLSQARDALEIERRGTPAFREKLREILELEAQARVRRESLEQIISVDKGTTLIDLFRKIQDAAEDIADRNGYDAVLIDDTGMELPQQPTEQVALQTILNRRVLYASGQIDITDEVRTLMNNESQSGTSSAQ